MLKLYSPSKGRLEILKRGMNLATMKALGKAQLEIECVSHTILGKF
jgi:hypothetical protein